MSRFQITAIIIAIVLTIATLGKSIVRQYDSSYCGDNFTKVSDSDDLHEGFIVYDNDTKVMYYVSTDDGNYAGNYGTMTLLVNADGSPKIYEQDTSSAEE